MNKNKQYKDRVLLVEDDKNLNSIIEDILTLRNYDVVSCFDGDTALIYYTSQKFDLALMDIMMPKMDGITLAREIRKMDEFTPIIFLTAKSTKEDTLKGYKVGADDYITKPFDIEELLARIEAVLKRTKFSESLFSKNTESAISIGDYLFDTETLTLHYKKQEVYKLTKKEGQLLKLLYLKKDEVLTRGLALKAIWGSDDYFMGRSMDVYLSKLRKYFKQDNRINIENIHGVGFKLTTK